MSEGGAHHQIRGIRSKFPSNLTNQIGKRLVQLSKIKDEFLTCCRATSPHWPWPDIGHIKINPFQNTTNK